jgi:hypothetical protein
MADTAALVVALSAQLTKFEKDMQKAVGIADRGVKDIENRFAKLNPSAGDGFAKFETRLKQFATVGGISLLINQIIELNRAVAQIGEAAETLGVSTEEIQKLRFAVVATGGAAETADHFMEAFSRKVADAAQGSGDLYNFLRVNNIEAAKFVKLPLNEQIAQYADLIKNASNQQERLNIAAIASSRSLGPQMVQALQGGREGLKQYGDELDRLGGVLSEETVAKAKVANIEFAKLQTLLGTFAKIAAVEAFELLGNAIVGAANAVSEFIRNFEFLRNLKRKGEELLGIPPGYDPMQTAPPQVTIDAGAGTTKTYNAQTEALNKLIESTQKRIQLMNVEAQTIGLTVGKQTELKTQVELENQAKEKNIPLTDAVNQRIRQTAIAAGQAAQALEEVKDRWRGMNEAVQFAGNQMIDIMVGLTSKTMTAAEAMRHLTQALLKAVLQAALLGQGPLGNILGFGATSPGGTGGLLGGVAGALFKRQGGGPVRAGSPYVVGEHGPELFVPKSSGQIVPNQPSRGGTMGGTAITINNYTARDTETRQSSQQGPNGERIIIDIVKKAQARGELDDVNRGRFGLRPAKVR